MIRRILHLLVALTIGSLVFLWWVTTPNRRFFLWSIRPSPKSKP